MSQARISNSALKSRRIRAVQNASGPRGIQAGWTIEEPAHDKTRAGLQKKHWDFLPARLRRKIERAGTKYSDSNQLELGF